MRKFSGVAMLFAFVAFIAFLVACSSDDKEDKGPDGLGAPVRTEAILVGGLIEVIWGEVAGAVEYNVYRSNSEGGELSFRLIAVVPDTFHLDASGSALARYRVAGVCANGNEGAMSAVFSAPCVSLGAVSNLNAVAGTFGGELGIRLDWTNVNGANRYFLFYSNSPITIGSVDNEEVVESNVRIEAVHGSSFTLGNVEPSETYYFRVRAASDCGLGAFSNMVDVSTGCLGPDAPEGLTATALTPTSIRVNWNAAEDATEYILQWGTWQGGWFSPAGNITLSALTHTLIVNAGTFFQFRIASINECGQGVWTTDTTVSAQTGCVSAPATVSGIAASGVSQTSIEVSWNEINDRTVIAYQVFRSTVENGIFTPIGRVEGRENTRFTNTLTEAELTANTPSRITYFYRVVAINSCGTGNVNTSGSANARILAPRLEEGTFPIVDSVAAVLNRTNNTIRISWARNVNADTYEIQRRTGTDTTWMNVGTTDRIEFTDLNLAPLTNYSYRVRARNSHSQESEWSAIVSARTECLTPEQVSITSSSLTSDRVQISWTAARNAEQYEVFRAVGRNSTVFESRAIVIGTEFIDANLDSTVFYQYYVIAINSCARSAMSSIVEVFTGSNCETLLPAPWNGNARASSATSMMVSWGTVPNAIAYNVYRGLTANVQSAVRVSGENPVRGTSWEDRGPLNRTTEYFYFVSSVNVCNLAGNRGFVASGITCRTPAQVVITDIEASLTENSLTIRWDNVEGATGYMVERSEAVGGQWDTIAANFRTGTPSVDFTQFVDRDLERSTRYWYRITALNDICLVEELPTFGIPSEIQNGRTRAAELSAITDLAVALPSITTTSVGLNWVRAADTNVVDYLVRIFNAQTSTVILERVVPQENTGDRISATISDLTPGTNYLFVVFARDEERNESPASNVASGSTIALPTVRNLAVRTGEGRITETSIELTWDRIHDTTVYIVRITDVLEGSSDEIEVRHPEAGNPTTKIEDLIPGTNYSFVVFVRDGSHDGLNSNVIAASTTALPTVSNLAVRTSEGEGMITKTSIELTWTRVGIATNYVVRITDALTGDPVGGDRVVLQTATGINPTMKIEGLTPGTDYRFVVLVRYSGHLGLPSNVLSAKTTELPTVSGLAVRADGITETSISLTWTKAETTADYVVRITNASTGTFAEHVAVANDFEAGVPMMVIRGLIPGTLYHLVVFVRDGGHDGLPSNILSASTTAAPTVSNLAVRTGENMITETSIELTWARVGDINTDYVVRITNTITGEPVGGDRVVSQSAEENLTTRIGGLTPGTSYDFVVFARYRGHLGLPSNVLTQSTTALPTVSGLAVREGENMITETSINLTWTRANVATNYLVRITNVSTGNIEERTVSQPAEGNPTTEIGGLIPGTSYRFVVLARLGGHNGLPSTALTQSTTAIPMVSGLAVRTGEGMITENSIGLTWTRTGGANISYIVRATNASTGDFVGEYTISQPAEGNPTTVISGLIPATTYRFVVLARSGVHNGPLSAAITQITAGEPCLSLAPAPTNFRATNVGNGFAEFAFDEVVGATRYQFRYDAFWFDGFNWHPAGGTTIWQNITNREFRIQEPIGRLVNVQVRAIDPCGEGIVARVEGITLCGTLAMPNLGLIGSGNGWAQISISQVSGAERYEFRVVGVSDWEDIGNTTQFQTNNFIGLNPGQYEIRVRAFNSVCGAGEEASIFVNMCDAAQVNIAGHLDQWIGGEISAYVWHNSSVSAAQFRVSQQPTSGWLPTIQGNFDGSFYFFHHQVSSSGTWFAEVRLQNVCGVWGDWVSLGSTFVP
ncbi:MAG: fibronectin type III domain-containing protein [Chitinivibrionia bacterium]|nr:fibronectin type III domain-containing protein [Chitinivibrionia bacterium]